MGAIVGAWLIIIGTGVIPFESVAACEAALDRIVALGNVPRAIPNIDKRTSRTSGAFCLPAEQANG